MLVDLAWLIFKCTWNKTKQTKNINMNMIIKAHKSERMASTILDKF